MNMISYVDVNYSLVEINYQINLYVFNNIINYFIK